MAIAENPRADRPDYVAGAESPVRITLASGCSARTRRAIAGRPHHCFPARPAPHRRAPRAGTPSASDLPKAPSYGTVLPFEDAADQLMGGTVGVDNQQAAGTQGISVH
jgi:hypothetical protein